ncbi:MAG: protein kinase [Oscillospiraceae bacterium]|jgi:hypothetical protein|nr:protein kinase [Oscillospiraceae bacterium]
MKFKMAGATKKLFSIILVACFFSQPIVFTDTNNKVSAYLSENVYNRKVYRFSIGCEGTNYSKDGIATSVIYFYDTKENEWEIFVRVGNKEDSFWILSNKKHKRTSFSDYARKDLHDVIINQAGNRSIYTVRPTYTEIRESIDRVMQTGYPVTTIDFDRTSYINFGQEIGRECRGIQEFSAGAPHFHRQSQPQHNSHYPPSAQFPPRQSGQSSFIVPPQSQPQFNGFDCCHVPVAEFSPQQREQCFSWIINQPQYQIYPDPSLQSQRLSSRVFKESAYFPIRNVGQGSFGICFTASLQPQDSPSVYYPFLGNIYCIKKMPCVDSQNQTSISKEIGILNQVKGIQGVVQFVEAIQQEGTAYIVMENAGVLNLDELMKQMSGGFNKIDLLKLMFWFAQALKGIGSVGIAHRDLKPANVMLSFDGLGHLMNMNFVDFGTAIPSSLAKTAIGSPLYMALEALCARPYDGQKADVWSLGCMFYELVTREHAYKANSIPELVSTIQTGQVNWQAFENELQDKGFSSQSIGTLSDLARNMIKVDVSSRCNIDMVLKAINSVIAFEKVQWGNN